MPQKPHLGQGRGFISPLIGLQVDFGQFQLVTLKKLLRIIHAHGVVRFLDIDQRDATWTGIYGQPLAQTIKHPKNRQVVGHLIHHSDNFRSTANRWTWSSETRLLSIPFLISY